MGKHAIKVASVDVDKLLGMLNAALSEMARILSILGWSKINGRTNEK